MLEASLRLGPAMARNPWAAGLSGPALGLRGSTMRGGGVLAQATNLRLRGLCWVPGRRGRGMARRPSAWEGNLVLQLASRGRGGTLLAQWPARLSLGI